MSLKDVIDRFALVSELSQEEISRWIFLILDCIKYFESICNIDALKESDKKRLSYACAVFAYYKYSLCKSEAVHSFKAGDIQISESSSLIEKTSSLWQLQKNEISDIVDFSQSSCFVRVRT